MKNAVRIAAAIIVLAAAGLAIERWCIAPYRLNIVKKTVEQRTFKAYDSAPRESAAIIARTNLEMLARADGDCRQDVDVCMEVAANERLLGRWQEAIAAYQDALRLDHRPEIYYNLAVTQLEAGDRENAIENFVRAIRFSPDVGSIPDADVNVEAHRRANRAVSAPGR